MSKIPKAEFLLDITTKRLTLDKAKIVIKNFCFELGVSEKKNPEMHISDGNGST